MFLPRDFGSDFYVCMSLYLPYMYIEVCGCSLPLSIDLFATKEQYREREWIRPCDSPQSVCAASIRPTARFLSDFPIYTYIYARERKSIEYRLPFSPREREKEEESSDP